MYYVLILMIGIDNHPLAINFDTLYLCKKAGMELKQNFPISKAACIRVK